MDNSKKPKSTEPTHLEQLNQHVDRLLQCSTLRSQHIQEREKLYVVRASQNTKQTLGVIVYMGQVLAFVLELPWYDNRRVISRIPSGIFPWVKHTSPKYASVLWLHTVPNRSEILLHRGNYYGDTKGCLLPGLSLKDINRDGFLDVKDSAEAMRSIIKQLPRAGHIETIDDFALGKEFESIFSLKKKR